MLAAQRKPWLRSVSRGCAAFYACRFAPLPCFALLSRLACMSRRRVRVVVSLLVVALLAGGALWFWFARGGPDTARAAELVRQKNIGLARLENLDGPGGVAAFETITTDLPDQPLGPRNLTVARVIALDALPPGDDAVRQPVLAAADAAVAKLREIDPDPVVPRVLAARIARQRGDTATAVSLLREAAETRPQAAWLWFELYQTVAASGDAAAASDLLHRAFDAAPENLWIGRLWLLDQAERHDPQIAATLDALGKVLTPLAEGIRLRTRVEPLKLIADARAAAAAENWPVVTRSARFLANVTAPEEQAQSDKLRVDRNVLEFVLVDFPPEYYTATGLQRLPAGQAIPVTFTATPLPVPDLAGDPRAVRLLDFDLDGRLDIALLTDRTLRVLVGSPAGWTDAATFDLPAGADFTALHAADLDNDAAPGKPAPEENPDGRPCHAADIDFVLTGPSGVLVLENRLEGDLRSLVAVEQPAPLAAIKNVTAAALFDLDLDGDLDLFAAGSGSQGTPAMLWLNLGNRTFEEVSARSKLPEFAVTTALPADLDRDIDIDLLVGGPGGAGYLENLRHGELRFRSLGEDAAGPAPRTPAAATAFEILDANADASWDLLCFDKTGVSLTRSATPELGHLIWTDTQPVVDIRLEAMRTLDYDNDGLTDLLTWGNGGARLFRNTGGTPVAWKERRDLLLVRDPVRAADAGDIDNDGDLDLLILTAAGLSLHTNAGGNANAWLDVSLLAAQIKGGVPSASGRVNHAGLGSLLELKAGPTYQAAVVRDGITHFGLGNRSRADALRVVWTNGIPANLIEPDPREFVCEEQTLKGSCPYLYTWDGEKFVFATDLLWASPIGLQFAEGLLAPTRAWENLLISGDLLKERNGEYVVQMTEELWEAAYFDEITLMTVDHPPDVAVYSNEKVAPPQAAEFKIHTVRTPHNLAAAVDARGRDILPQIRNRDEQYLKPFTTKLRQGYTEPTALELTLGDAADGAEHVTLFLTGWIYPTDTSINVGLGQNPDVPGPRPPSLAVPDGKGGWAEVLPSLGFPGGKTKTIAVDLSGLLPPGDPRVRISTSMELYWDQVFFTADDPPAAVQIQTARLKNADLHYRGCSAPIIHPNNGPERYDYNRLTPVVKWPPMNGAFTRYGDVTDLLTAADDRQAVLAAGDEMTLRFTIPDPPPAGWKRDFILHNVGYDKDADLNTVYGRTVEPLPFLKMQTYPYPAEDFPDTPAMRDYLRTYQTRFQSDGAFRHRLRPGFIDAPISIDPRAVQ